MGKIISHPFFMFYSRKKTFFDVAGRKIYQIWTVNKN